MDFGTNKTPIEVIREGAFGGNYFIDIYSSINGTCYRKSWKEFDQLKTVNNYDVKCGTLLRFWESKGWINEIDPYGWFQWYFKYWLGRRSKDDKRQINRWKKIVSRFRGILVKMIKDTSINLMIIQFCLKLDKFYCIGVMN